MIVSQVSLLFWYFWRGILVTRQTKEHDNALDLDWNLSLLSKVLSIAHNHCSFQKIQHQIFYINVIVHIISLSRSKHMMKCRQPECKQNSSYTTWACIDGSHHHPTSTFTIYLKQVGSFHFHCGAPNTWDSR